MNKLFKNISKNHTTHHVISNNIGIVSAFSNNKEMADQARHDENTPSERHAELVSASHNSYKIIILKQFRNKLGRNNETGYRGVLNQLLLTIVTIFILFVVSCDKVEAPFTNNNENIDTAKCPVPQFPAITNVYKKILVEDFTGHKCGYCPRAHVALKNLIDTYGDTIVGVALHVSDYYANPDATGLYTYNFRTSEGTQIDQNFHISDGGLPKGMINRTKYNNNIIIDHNSWQTVVQSMLADQPRLAIQIINNYNASDSSFCTHVKLTFLEDITDTLMFFCGLTEDSIIKPQKNYDLTPNDIPVYTHMHVFRGSLNGAFGVTISNNITKKDSTLIKSYFYNLKGKDFVHKNIKVFAYVYKLNGDIVLQAEEKNVQ